jgi:hypothetical protein
MKQKAAATGSPSPGTNPPPGTTPPPGETSEDEWLKQFEAGYTRRGGAVVGKTVADKKGKTTSIVYTPEQIYGKTVPTRYVTMKETYRK